MVLLVKACPGPVQSGMALDVGTINPAYYFLRASHPINNSFAVGKPASCPSPGLASSQPARKPYGNPSPYITALAVGVSPTLQTLGPPGVDSAGGQAPGKR